MLTEESGIAGDFETVVEVLHIRRGPHIRPEIYARGQRYNRGKQ